MARQQAAYCASLLLLALLRLDVAAVPVTGAPSAGQVPAPAVPVEPSRVHGAEAFCLDVLHGPSLRQRFASRAATLELDAAVFRAAFGPLWSSRRSATDEEVDRADTERDGEDEREADADLDSTVKKDSPLVRLDALQLLEGSRAAHRRLAHQCADRLAKAWSEGIRDGTGRGPESRQVYTFLYEADYSELAGSLHDLQQAREKERRTDRDAEAEKEPHQYTEEGVGEPGAQMSRREGSRVRVAWGASQREVEAARIRKAKALELEKAKDRAHQREVNIAIAAAREQGLRVRRYVNRLLVVVGTALDPEIVLEEGLSHKDLTEWKFAEKSAEGNNSLRGCRGGRSEQESRPVCITPSAFRVLDENWLLWDWAPLTTTTTLPVDSPLLSRPSRRRTFLWKTITIFKRPGGEPRHRLEGYKETLSEWFTRSANLGSGGRSGLDPQGAYAVVANVQERELVEPWAPPYALEYVDSTSTSRSSLLSAREVDGAAFNSGDRDRGEREREISFSWVEPDSGYIGLALLKKSREWKLDGPRAWFFARADAGAVCRDLAPALSSSAEGDVARLRASYALARGHFLDGDDERQRVLFVRDLPARDRLLLLLLLTVRRVVLMDLPFQQQQYSATDYEALIARLAAIDQADLRQAMEDFHSTEATRQWMTAARRPNHSLSWMAMALDFPDDHDLAPRPHSLDAEMRRRMGAAAAAAIRQRICRDQFGLYDLFARPVDHLPTSSLYAPGTARRALLAGGTLQQHSGLVAAHPAVVRTMRRYFANRLLREEGDGDCINQVVAEAKFFGSAVSGFGTRHSDLDVSFELPQQLLDSSSSVGRPCLLESLPEGENWTRGIGRDWARVIYKNKLGEHLNIDGGGDNFEEDGYNFRPPSWRDTFLAHLGKTIAETASTRLPVRSVAELTSDFWRKFWLLENVVKRLFETNYGVIMVGSQKKRSEEVWMSWLSCEIQYDEGNGHVIGKAKVAVRKSLLDMEPGVVGDSDRYRGFVVFNLDLVVARFDEVAQTKLRALQSLAVVSPVIRDVARLFLRFAKAKGVAGTLSPKTEFAVMPSFRFLLVFIEFLLARHFVVESEAADAHLQHGANMADGDLPEVTTTGPARVVRGFALHPRFKQEASRLRQNAWVLLSEFVSDFAGRIAKPPASPTSPGSDAFALPGQSAQALVLLLEDRKRMPKRTTGPLRDTLFAVRRNVTEQLSQSTSYLAHNPWEIGTGGGRGDPQYFRAPVRAAYPIALWTRDLWLFTTEEAAASQTNSAQSPYRFMNPMPRLLPKLCEFLELLLLSAKQQTSGADGPGADGEGSAGSVAATGCGIPVKWKWARKEQPGGSCSGAGGFCFGLPSRSPQASMLSDAARSPSSGAASSSSTPPGVLLRPQAASPGLQMMGQPSLAELPQRSATPVPRGTVPGLGMQAMLLHAELTNRTHAPTPAPSPGLHELIIGPPPGLDRPQPAGQLWDSVAARGVLPGFGPGHGHDILAGSSQATTPGTGSASACASDPDRATQDSSTGSRGGGRWRQVQGQARFCPRDSRSAAPELTSNQWASTSPATSGQIALAGLDVTLAGEIRARASSGPGSSSFSCGGGACSFARSSSSFSSCEQGGAASSPSSSGFYAGEGGQQPQPRAIAPYTYRPGASLAKPNGSYAAPSVPYKYTWHSPGPGPAPLDSITEGGSASAPPSPQLPTPDRDQYSAEQPWTATAGANNVALARPAAAPPAAQWVSLPRFPTMERQPSGDAKPRAPNSRVVVNKKLRDVGPSAPAAAGGAASAPTSHQGPTRTDEAKMAMGDLVAGRGRRVELEPGTELDDGIAETGGVVLDHQQPPPEIARDGADAVGADAVPEGWDIAEMGEKVPDHNLPVDDIDEEAAGSAALSSTDTFAASARSTAHAEFLLPLVDRELVLPHSISRGTSSPRQREVAGVLAEPGGVTWPPYTVTQRAGDLALELADVVQTALSDWRWWQ